MNPHQTTFTLRVDLKERGYDICIGPSIINQAPSFLPPLTGRRLFIICDEAVESYGQALANALLDHGFSISTLPLSGGEGAKSLSTLEGVLTWLFDNKVDRGAVIFAVGGGVIGDLAGFAAAIALRGVAFVQVPTTLLAQVDSAVGGKTGINAPQGKNLIGAFYQPICVLCDTGTLKTLPLRERRAGYAEIIKYALLGDADFFEWLEKYGAHILNLEEPYLSQAIHKSLMMKAKIVGQDERERHGGTRALLNLGHTFAHALETAAGFDGRLLHGEAVGIGLVLAARLSAAMRLCPQDVPARIEHHLRALGLKTSIGDITPPLLHTPDQLMTLMAQDKKALGGQIHFILLRGIGDAFQSDGIDAGILKDVLAKG